MYRILHQFGHPPPAIELFQDLDDRFTLGGRAREAHSISQFALWNIDRRLHASIIAISGFPLHPSRNPLDALPAYAVSASDWARLTGLTQFL